MRTASDHGPTARLSRTVGAITALLLLSGCAADDSASSPDVVPSAAATSTKDQTYSEVIGEFYAAYDGLEEIDGVAEDFPAEIPLPEGDLVLSHKGDGVWDMIFETDEPEQVEDIVAGISRIVPLVEEDDAPDDGKLWTFSDDRYVIQVQMQPGPMPPPMVAIALIER